MPRDADGGPVSVPGSGMHVMVSGDPKSGKSWIAGLITERLLDRGYRLCVLDPEGDYLALAERPEVLAFGDRLTLPPAPTIPGLLERHPFSIRAQPRQAAAAGSGGVCDVGAGGTRAAPASHRHPTLDRRGRGAGRVPRGAALCGSFAAADVGTMLLITYRPSLGTSSPGSCRRAGRPSFNPRTPPHARAVARRAPDRRQRRPTLAGVHAGRARPRPPAPRPPVLRRRTRLRAPRLPLPRPRGQRDRPGAQREGVRRCPGPRASGGSSSRRRWAAPRTARSSPVSCASAMCGRSGPGGDLSLADRLRRRRTWSACAVCPTRSRSALQGQY